MEKNLNSRYLPMQNAKGPFIGIRRKGARGTIPGPKYWHNGASTAVKTWQKPHFRDCSRAARAAPPAVHYCFAPVGCTSWILDLSTQF